MVVPSSVSLLSVCCGALNARRDHGRWRAHFLFPLVPLSPLFPLCFPFLSTYCPLFFSSLFFHSFCHSFFYFLLIFHSFFDTIQCLFQTISCVHAARRTRTRPRPTHNTHARVGAMTFHHPDWLDHHPSGSWQDTHSTLEPARAQAVGGSSHVHRARHQENPHKMVAEHDTTHWCQNGRPTRGLPGDAPRTVTSETLVTRTRRTSQETSGGRDQMARLNEADNEEEASTGGSAQRTQERFPGMTISDELLQMIEKVAEKPDKVRTVTRARA